MTIHKSRIVRVSFEAVLGEDFDDFEHADKALEREVEDAFYVVGLVEIEDTGLHLHKQVSDVQRIENGLKYHVHSTKQLEPFTGKDTSEQAADLIARTERQARFLPVETSEVPS